MRRAYTVAPCDEADGTRTWDVWDNRTTQVVSSHRTRAEARHAADTAERFPRVLRCAAMLGGRLCARERNHLGEHALTPPPGFSAVSATYLLRTP